MLVSSSFVSRACRESDVGAASHHISRDVIPRSQAQQSGRAAPLIGARGLRPGDATALMMRRSGGLPGTGGGGGLGFGGKLPNTPFSILRTPKGEVDSLAR